MLKRHIHLALIIACVSICLAGLSLFYIFQQGNHHQIGELVFSQTQASLHILQKIVIQRQGQTITLLKDDQFWRVKEAHNYYANFNILHDLLENITSSRILGISLAKQAQSVSAREPTDKDYTKISMYGINNQSLDKVLIHDADQSNNSRQAVIPPLADSYIVSGEYNLPQHLTSWLPQPLISITHTNLKAIQINQNKIERFSHAETFHIAQDKLKKINPTNMVNFEFLTHNLIYSDVISAQDFDDTKYPHRTELNFTCFSGLIYRLTIYTNGQEYWSSLNLLTEPLSTIESNDYIRANKFLYDGWFFKLPNSTGKQLFYYKFNFQ